MYLYFIIINLREEEFIINLALLKNQEEIMCFLLQIHCSLLDLV